jgi:Leucine-rich repeat (LRR) protein
MNINQANQFINIAGSLNEDQYLKRKGTDFQFTTEVRESLNPDEITDLALLCLACIKRQPDLEKREQILGNFLRALKSYSQGHLVIIDQVIEEAENAKRSTQTELQRKERDLKIKESRSDFAVDIFKLVSSYVSDLANPTPDEIEQIQGLLNQCRNETEAMKIWVAIAYQMKISEEVIAKCKTVENIISLIQEEIAHPLIAICNKLSDTLKASDFLKSIEWLTRFEQAKRIDFWIRSHPEIQTVTRLQLNTLGLRRLPPVLFEFTGIDHLSLVENQLRDLSGQIGKFQKLRNLYLDFNLLEELPMEIAELKQLNVLDVGFNQIKKIPLAIRQLKLQTFDTRNNPLAS